MKGIFNRTLADGSTAVISCTTRRANYTDLYYGKFTFWPSREAYQRGICKGTQTYKNILLSDVRIGTSDLQTEAERFIDVVILPRIEKEEEI